MCEVSNKVRIHTRIAPANKEIGSVKVRRWDNARLFDKYSRL